MDDQLVTEAVLLAKRTAIDHGLNPNPSLCRRRAGVRLELWAVRFEPVFGTPLHPPCFAHGSNDRRTVPCHFLGIDAGHGSSSGAGKPDSKANS